MGRDTIVSCDAQRQTLALKETFTVADRLVEYLNALSIEFAFGIPGGAIEPFYNALALSERRGGVRAIVARHETGAAFMANGYAVESGRIGVCCATTGPGATNLITGVASAYINQTSMLVITAQSARNTFGKGAFQESSCTGVNTVSIFESCTRYNTMVSHPEQLECKLAAALMMSKGPIPGPVHLSVPLDVMRAKSPVVDPIHLDLERLLKPAQLVDRNALIKLISLTLSSKKSVFLIGEGAKNAIPQIQACASLLNAKLLTTPQGKSLINAYHPLFVGVFGFAGHESANAALSDPDVDTVFSVGTRLGEWTSNGWDARLLLNNRLVHIDDQSINFINSPMAKLHVEGDIQSILAICYVHLK